MNREEYLQLKKQVESKYKAMLEQASHDRIECLVAIDKVYGLTKEQEVEPKESDNGK